MKIKELIEQLRHEDPEKEVCMSKDQEGNQFFDLGEVSRGVRVAEYGEILIYDGTESEAYDGKETKNVIVLWPN